MQRNLLADMARFDGLALRSQLLVLGHSTRSLTRATGTDVVRSPRRGWLAAPNAPADAVRAVTLGGKLGGASALRSYGIWADGDTLVVSTAPTASRLIALQPGETRVWMRERFVSSSGRAWRVSVADALLQHAELGDRLSLIASVDSALYTGRITVSGLESLVSVLPRHLRKIGGVIDSRSMSGTESKLRVACRDAGLHVDSQASVNHVGFVDLLIDGWLVVDVDSRKHHDGQSRQHVDRVRDGNSVLGRFGNLRFDYDLVQFDLDWCMQVIAAKLREGRP